MRSPLKAISIVAEKNMEVRDLIIAEGTIILGDEQIQVLKLCLGKKNQLNGSGYSAMKLRHSSVL